MENTINKTCTQTLQQNLKTLIEKHNDCIQKCDYGTALNIMKNIDRVVWVLQNMEYQTMTSKFKIEEKGETKELLSVWKQRELGDITDIKNMETYVIKGKYNGKFNDFVDSLSENWNKFSDDEKSEVLKLMGCK